MHIPSDEILSNIAATSLKISGCQGWMSFWIVRALELYDFLERAGVAPWLDQKMLRGGDDWEHEIKNADG
jgi:hypothetical protein